MVERIERDKKHSYIVDPVIEVEPAGSNLTYDQFIKLRDTLVYSDKFYGNNAGRSLIIGTKLDGTPTNTIEIWKPNIMDMSFQPGGTTDDSGSTGNYVSVGDHTSTNPISCEIIKTGRYRLQHKEQFNNISSSITRIHSYILQHKPDGSTQSRAVFDWEWNTPGEMKRITAFGYRECNLEKGDWLELKIEDQNGNNILSETAYDSNWWMVEYIDLAY